MKRLSVWARENGVSYNTAFRWFKDGTFPLPISQTETGSIFVNEDPKNETEIVKTLKEILVVLKEKL